MRRLDERIAFACSRLWLSSDLQDLAVRELGSRFLVVGYDPATDQGVILYSAGTLDRAEQSRDERLGDRGLAAKRARA